MMACPDVPGCEHSLNRCSCVCCLLVCRCRCAAQCGRSSTIRRQACAVQSVQQGDPLTAARQTAWQRQRARQVHQSSRPCSCSCQTANPSLEASIQRTWLDAAVQASEGVALRRHNSSAADRLPHRNIAAAATRHFRRAASSHHGRKGAHPHCSITPHPKRADDDRM